MRDSLIQRSGQAWRLAVGLVSMFIGFGAMVYGIKHLDSYVARALAVGGTATDLLAFAWLCISIRCPFCGMRWFWAAVKGQEQLQWVSWLRAQRVCPQCGHDGSS